MKLSKILNKPQKDIDAIEDIMKKRGFPPVIKSVENKNKDLVGKTLSKLNLSYESDYSEVKEAILKTLENHEKQLYKYVGTSEDNFDFDKVAEAARRVATATKGFFLKKDYAIEILKKRPPENTIKNLGYSNVDEMLKKEDVGDVFSALRFTETDEWMHETFDVAYNSFTEEDFEEREIDLRVLGDQFKEVAEKYVAKKHHNVSHLKEFGIIFLNPISQKGTGKFIRDFPLLLHYFHEISFYSKLFKKYSKLPNFNENFISLLRGDVAENNDVDSGDWLIVQRYLWKDNPEDQRLFMPRVNPEAIHWKKAQQDLVEMAKKEEGVDIDFWDELYWVAGLFENKIFSFEMEDNAMVLADKNNGKDSNYYYHQREAMWNKIFSDYVGGYDELEKYIIDNMDKGYISLN